METRKNIFIGALLSLSAFFGASCVNALVKLLSGQVPVFQILFLQNLAGTFIIFILSCCKKKKPAFYLSSHYGLLVTRAVGGLAAFYFVFVAVQHISVTNSMLLLNTSPFFIPFILLFFYKQSINHRLWAGIIPGFIGIALILNPSIDIFRWYALFPLLSGLGVAIIAIVLRQLHHYKEPTLRILFYLFACATLITLPFGLYAWQPLGQREWTLLALICIFGFCAQTFTTFSFRYGPPSTLAPLCYTSVLFALFFDWFFWQIIPSMVSLGAAILIIAGGLIALFIETNPKNLT